MRRDGPYATAAYATHIALELGQIPEERAPEEWATPDDADVGTTMGTTSVSDGEALDPPAVSVHVYRGMRFYDEQEDRVITFRKGTWFSHRSNPDLDYSTPLDALEVEFEEDENPYDPEGSPRVSMTGNEFARRIASGRYRNVTGETTTVEEGDYVGYHPVGEDEVRWTGYVVETHPETGSVTVEFEDDPGIEENVPLERIKALSKAEEA